MPREPKETAVFTGAKALTDAQLTELKKKFGIELKLRSRAASVNALINRIDLASSYDRTHPGYGRVYDKDADAATSIRDLIRPIDIDPSGPSR